MKIKLTIIFIFLSHIMVNASVIKEGEVSITEVIAHGLKVPIVAYEQEYGSWPQLKSDEFIKTLMGKNIRGSNPRELIFWLPKKKKGMLWWSNGYDNLDGSFRLIDGWGNPYHWKTSTKGERITLISNGKNGKFDNGLFDDMVFVIELKKKVEPVRSLNSDSLRESP